jgi:hypothetical protein
MYYFQVEDYLVRAREAFSQAIVLAVGGILGGGSIQEQEAATEQKCNEEHAHDLAGPIPFPPWLGQDGVRCVHAVVQQQVKSPML